MNQLYLTSTLPEDFWEVEGRNNVRENVRLLVLAIQGNSREMDVELTWTALKEPVTLQGSAERGKTYGGFSARFAARTNTVVRTDGETLTKDEDLNPRPWAESEGVFGGKKAVLRITSDEKNPGAPTFAGSPPNAAMLSFTQRSAAVWSSSV